MRTEYKTWTIEIKDEPDYTIDSRDNITSYDTVIFDKKTIPTSKHGISVMTKDNKFISAIICEGGGGSTIHARSFLTVDNKIFLCCGDHIYCLDLPSLNVNWKNQLDPATCFGIYQFDNDFIIHGELEISRIDKNGNKKWDFSGRDIFSTQDGKPSIELIQDKIKIRDWDGHEYLLNGDGKQVG